MLTTSSWTYHTSYSYQSAIPLYSDIAPPLPKKCFLFFEYENYEGSVLSVSHTINLSPMFDIHLSSLLIYFYINNVAIKILVHVIFSIILKSFFREYTKKWNYSITGHVSQSFIDKAKLFSQSSCAKPYAHQ